MELHWEKTTIWIELFLNRFDFFKNFSNGLCAKIKEKCSKVKEFFLVNVLS